MKIKNTKIKPKDQQRSEYLLDLLFNPHKHAKGLVQLSAEALESYAGVINFIHNPLVRQYAPYNDLIAVANPLRSSLLAFINLTLSVVRHLPKSTQLASTVTAATMYEYPGVKALEQVAYLPTCTSDDCGRPCWAPLGVMLLKAAPLAQLTMASKAIKLADCVASASTPCDGSVDPCPITDASTYPAKLSNPHDQLHTCAKHADALQALVAIAHSEAHK